MGVTRTDELWHQDSRGIKGGAEGRDFFGDAVGTADFDADGFDDLIVGIPGEGIGGEDRAGAVQVIYGSSDGLTGRDDLWHQDARGIAANVGEGDQFGHSVGAGDFDGDGFADLATGVVGEIFRGNEQAGAVHVLYGSSNGVTRRDQLWHQNDRGVAGAAEDGDLFGFSVFAADFDADGSDDLAVGVPGEGLAGSAASRGTGTCPPCVTRSIATSLSHQTRTLSTARRSRRDRSGPAPKFHGTRDILARRRIIR